MTPRGLSCVLFADFCFQTASAMGKCASFCGFDMVLTLKTALLESLHAVGCFSFFPQTCTVWVLHNGRGGIGGSVTFLALAHTQSVVVMQHMVGLNMHRYGHCPTGQTYSPLGFLFLKLPPPPCAVLLVDFYPRKAPWLVCFVDFWICDSCIRVGIVRFFHPPRIVGETIPPLGLIIAVNPLFFLGYLQEASGMTL